MNIFFSDLEITKITSKLFYMMWKWFWLGEKIKLEKISQIIKIVEILSTCWKKPKNCWNNNKNLEQDLKTKNILNEVCIAFLIAKKTNAIKLKHKNYGNCFLYRSNVDKNAIKISKNTWNCLKSFSTCDKKRLIGDIWKKSSSCQTLFEKKKIVWLGNNLKKIFC